MKIIVQESLAWLLRVMISFVLLALVLGEQSLYGMDSFGIDE